MTKHEKRYRETLTEARRIVIKIGTRVIANKTGKPEMKYLAGLVAQVAALRAKGHEVILVSSGAVGAGMEALGIRERPKQVPDLQMCAAVGQARLMSKYEALFLAKKLKVGQVLLTHSDFQHRIRLTNARRTLDHLLAAGVVPIINENDVVADEELKAGLSLGDNDYLGALVVKIVRADLFIILSTVNGLLNMQDPARVKRIACIEKLNKEAFKLVNPGANALSKGGMDSKLKAAQIAVKAGCPVVIAAGRTKHVLLNIMSAKDEGTLILSAPV